MIKNPILPGFHADPCMICVDDVFYIANSTFEYYPGVMISESKDLANWKTVGYPLVNKKHIDLKGDPKSAGVWAPSIQYHAGVYYLVYSDVKAWDKLPFKDVMNFITTTTDLYGEWSDPVYINSSGFDPSLYFEGDKVYFVNMEWDYRKKGKEAFSGIIVTELSKQTLKPSSKPVKVFKGSKLGVVEGPHLMKRGAYYYIIAAEGGTSYGHALTVARSKSIYGPYELHPNQHLLTSWKESGSYLQKCGHGNLCEGPDGRWWVTFLCGRPLNQRMNCPLGRETGVNEVVWKDDWPYLKNGTLVPDVEFDGYGVKKEEKAKSYDFRSDLFNADFQSLRVPCSYEVKEDGTLRIYGKESLLSTHEQSMLVRRQDSFSFMAETSFAFAPDHFMQMAGMIYRYSEENQFYLRVSYDETIGHRTLNLLSFDHYQFSMGEKEIVIPDGSLIYERLVIEDGVGFFYYSFDGMNYMKFPQLINSELLSDEHETPMGFTGAFVGMACQDLQYRKAYADFKSFKYKAME